METAMRQTRRCILLAAVLILLGAQSTQAQVTAKQVVDLFGRDHGLCVIVGSGDAASPKLAAELAANGKMLVHGLAFDDAALARARAAVAAGHVDGLASIEKLSVAPLPHRDNLVNLIVVPNADVAMAAGFTAKDALRALAPFGKLITFRNGKHEVVTKPMPKDMDEWTHAKHGPDGNAVSKDKHVRFPLGLRWHAGLPMNLQNRLQSSNTWSSTRGLAVAGGRCFMLSASVIENLGPKHRSLHGIDQFATARDAFNGLLLWRVRVGPTFYGGLISHNRAPFVGASDVLYVASEKGKLLALDAATGAVARTFDTQHAPGRILVDRGVVAVAGWKSGVRVGALHGVDRRRMEFTVDGGAVEAFDTRTTARLWKHDKFATTIRSSDGVLFMVEQDGPDRYDRFRPKRGSKEPRPARPDQAVVAVDLRTGRALWRVSDKSIKAAGGILRIDSAGCGAVAVSFNGSKRHIILSAKDGRVILDKPLARTFASFFNGELHLGAFKYNPLTGKPTGRAAVRLGTGMCAPGTFVNGIIVANRGGGFVDRGKRRSYGGARGACLFGSAPAYGALYTPQNWCACAPAQVPGFVVFGSIAHEPTPAEMAAEPSIEKGSAFGKLTGTPGKDEWPMFRGTADRGSAASGPAPGKLDVLWRKSVAKAGGKGPVIATWAENLREVITAPVIAEGAVAVAVPDRNQVVVLDAATGAERWRRTVGGRVDSPPTINRGTCLFGSHDGYVYAMSLRDGELAWRMRAAPLEERMVSYGKVESPWPVIGTVLVNDGRAYASAGRTQGSDGGIVVRAFDPATGKVAWSRAIPPGSSYRGMRRNDLVFKEGNCVRMMQTRMDPATGADPAKPTPAESGKEPAAVAKPVLPNVGLEGFISPTWTRLGARKHKAMRLGNVSGVMVSWGTDIAAITRAGITVAAYDRAKITAPDKKHTRAPGRWRVNVPKGHQVTSVVVCPNAVVIGGGAFEKETRKGFVKVLSLDKGTVLAEHTFDAPVAYSAVAVAGGRIYATLADGSVVCLGAK
jgi:outer membrane protein assembly factor BamB